MNNITFEKILKDCLSKIDDTIAKHNGVLNTMHKRLQFEKWFQIELYASLLNEFNNSMVKVEIEYELKSKSSKRGQTIDIAILEDGKELIGLELKIITTNYVVQDFDNKTKRVTEIVQDFIHDLTKTKEFKYSYSLALVFPFPSDTKHRNYSDFKKQEQKMREVGELSSWQSISKNNFISKYYLLFKENKI